MEPIKHTRKRVSKYTKQISFRLSVKEYEYITVNYGNVSDFIRESVVSMIKRKKRTTGQENE